MVKGINTMERREGGVDHIIIKHQTGTCNSRKGKETYYANPPQTPSRLMKVNTNKMLRLSDLSPKTPTADSYIKVKKTKNWIMAGKDISRTGSAGMPMDIDAREKNTMVRYTSFFSPENT